MSEPTKNFGKLVSMHGTSAMFLQRAAIVAFLAFVFFLAMLIGFYLLQTVIYFVLSTAFLVVYLFTLIGWLMQKRNVVSIFEDGINYKKFAARWGEIVSAELIDEASDRKYLELQKSDREKVLIPSSIHGFEKIVDFVQAQARK